MPWAVQNRTERGLRDSVCSERSVWSPSVGGRRCTSASVSAAFARCCLHESRQPSDAPNFFGVRAAEPQRSGGASFSACWLAAAPTTGEGESSLCDAASRLLLRYEASNRSSFREAFELRCVPRSREKFGLRSKKKRYFRISEILTYVK